jgi:pantoate--beta-alanine ligase
VQIIREIPALRQSVAALKAGGRTLALVPTMGALHAGHMALVAAAAHAADHVAASIFVNPAQFGPNEDFDAYPRTEAADAALLQAAGAALLWAPNARTVYPAGFATRVQVAGLGDRYCGAARPGHFDGVATVVTKLLTQVAPDIALFGEKDWQQLAIIRRLVRDLDLPVTIIGVPIARDADGLALSSRNAYLTVAERTAAPALAAALRTAAVRIAGGDGVAAVLAQAERDIIDAGFHRVDYVALCDADTLEPLAEFSAPARLLAAARIGKTRLIDNFPVG